MQILTQKKKRRNKSMKAALLGFFFQPPTALYKNAHNWSMQKLIRSENQPSTPPTQYMHHMVPKSSHPQTSVNAKQT
jgi:hypothetical protein